MRHQALRLRNSLPHYAHPQIRRRSGDLGLRIQRRVRSNEASSVDRPRGLICSSQFMKNSRPNRINRRQFVHRTAAGVALFNILPGVLPGADVRSPNEKLNVAGIGIGSRGGADTAEVAGLGHNIVATCDVDEKYAAKEIAKYPDAKRFKDYRVMLDKMGKEIDAVI